MAVGRVEPAEGQGLEISREAFETALEAFAEVVGQEWVFVEREDILTYRDAYSPFIDTASEPLPSAAIAPASVEEIQAIMRIANSLRIPLYPISCGRNLAFGGSAPNQPGCVTVDLKRMNRIIEVNAKQGYCLVEPGVSYYDLYNYLRENDIPLMLSVPDPGWGSVLGNALDKGSGYTSARYRNHFDTHCGMEVVLANGEIIRTGNGGLPGSKAWQTFKFGYGPELGGLFCQSNFGIVTKMGFWLMPRPESFFEGVIECKKADDLPAIIDTWAYLENSGIIDGFPDLSSPVFGTPGVFGTIGMATGPALSPDPAYQALVDAGAHWRDFEPYAAERGIPFWRLRVTFYGPKAIIREKWAYCQERFARAVAGAEFSDGIAQTFPIPEEVAATSDIATMFGVPMLRGLSTVARNNFMPDVPRGIIWTTLILPKDGHELIKASETLVAAAKSLGIWSGLQFITPYGNWERNLKVPVVGLTTDDPEWNAKLTDGLAEIIRIGAANGWPEFRSHPALQETLRSVYAFEGSSVPRLHDTLKAALDPVGIIAPGRYGIWPRDQWEH